MVKQKLDFQNRINVGWRSIISPFKETLDENQDNYLIIDSQGLACYMQDQKEVYKKLVPGNWKQGHIRLAVLDGMGGHDNGREAAEAVVECLLGLAPCTTVEELSIALDNIHQKLNKKWRGTPRTPGTTLTLLEMPIDSGALLYHVGDSRLLEVTEEKTEVLSIDHVPATQSAIHGYLDEENWKQQVWHEDRYILRQAMIMGNALYQKYFIKMPLSADLYPLIEGNFKNADFLKSRSDRRIIKLKQKCVYILATDGAWTFEKPWFFLQKMSKIAFSDKRGLMSSKVDKIIAEHNLLSDKSIGGDNTTIIGFELMSSY